MSTGSLRDELELAKAAEEESSLWAWWYSMTLENLRYNADCGPAPGNPELIGAYASLVKKQNAELFLKTTARRWFERELGKAECP